jgi:hypothetical protein
MISALYAIILGSLAYLLSPWLRALLPERRRRLREGGFGGRAGGHIAKLMRALRPSEDESRIRRRKNTFLLLISLIAALGFYLPYSQGFGPGAALLIAIFFASLPYALLRARLLSARIEGSYEGQIILAEILNEYKINYFNMSRAIDQSIKRLEAAPIGRGHLFRLSLSLRVVKSEAEIRQALDGFIYAAGTEWARMLAENIYYAAAEGMTVTAGLEDLLAECGHTKKAIERQKRLNNESDVMVKVLTPLMYFILIGTLPYYFKIPLAEVVSTQLFTPMGLLLLLLIIALWLLGIVLVRLISRPKFDV